MQANVAAQIDKIWDLVDWAKYNGRVSFGLDGAQMTSRVDHMGLKIDLKNNTVVRLRGAGLDVHILSDSAAPVLDGPFHGLALPKIILHFAKGSADVLDFIHRDMIAPLGPKRAA